MTLRLPKTAALFVLLAAPAVMHAQNEISASEEQRLEALAREQAETYLPRSNVTVGFRVLSSGARVNYTNLGAVGFGGTVAPIADGAVRRLYDNGSVDVDVLRSNEKDADGIQTSTPGERYYPTHTETKNVTDANGNVIGTTEVVVSDGDYLSYTPGLTRFWGYGSADQTTVRPGYMAMSSYSTVSDGASLAKKQGPTGGVELQFSRVVGKITGRTQWSLLAGISLNDINNKIAGDVLSTLRTNTDFYSLHGQAAPDLDSNTNTTTGVVTTSYNGPSYDNLNDSNGNLLLTNGLETTVPISAVPEEHVETAAAGAATVHGKWQVKGAYFMVKMGPAVRTQLTERLGLSASLGVAGAYSGTHYSVVETFEIPSLGHTVGTPDTEQSDAAKFVSGFYADLNFEWAANESTGLFGGFTAQKLGDYEQLVGNRAALIDLGTSVGIRGGISIRF